MEPKTLAEYPGQDSAKAVLAPALAAARKGKPLPHILLNGPPGVGKTTLAQIIANETNVKCHVTQAQNIDSFEAFMDIVFKMSPGDVLFIDEIHGLATDVEELMYQAIDKFGFFTTVGNKQSWVPLPQFSIIGATTKAGGLTGPMRTRFGITAELDFYAISELSDIAIAYGIKLGLFIAEEAALEIGRCSRGTARTTYKLVDRVHDIAFVEDLEFVYLETAQRVLEGLGIDHNGLNGRDRKFLRTIRDVYHNQPVGMGALAATLGEDEDNLLSVVEPFLLRQGFLSRTPRGRKLTTMGLLAA